MKLHANSVSTSSSGDYYQVLFEEEDGLTESDGPYLSCSSSLSLTMVMNAILRLMTGSMRVTFVCFASTFKQMEYLLRSTGRTIGIFKSHFH